VTIEHAPLGGVTPEMLAWWYGHVRGSMPYAGGTYPRYLVWHPLDHISYEVREPLADGSVGPGAKLHITEALGRDLRNLIDIVVTIERLDESGAVVGRRVLGTPVVVLENVFEPIPQGTRYVSRLTVGGNTPLARLCLNRIARGRAFPDWKVDPWWIRHHIEEIGNLENFLPELFRDQWDEATAL
jgi:DAPG hydrolase PhiG domain